MGRIRLILAIAALGLAFGVLLLSAAVFLARTAGASSEVVDGVERLWGMVLLAEGTQSAEFAHALDFIVVLVILASVLSGIAVSWFAEINIRFLRWFLNGVMGDDVFGEWDAAHLRVPLRWVWVPVIAMMLSIAQTRI